jgi:hypothetical protein
MKYTVGFRSKYQVEIGSASFVNGVFFSIFRLAGDLDEERLLHRLYKSYVSESDFAKTFNLVLRIKNYCCEYTQFFEAFDKAIEETQYYQKKQVYYPIRIEIVGIPYSFLEVPLEDYDNLEGDPLWMRPEYVLEKYGGGK